MHVLATPRVARDFCVWRWADGLRANAGTSAAPLLTGSIRALYLLDSCPTLHLFA
jgi:hypothetical protein